MHDYSIMGHQEFRRNNIYSLCSGDEKAKKHIVAAFLHQFDYRSDKYSITGGQCGDTSNGGTEERSRLTSHKYINRLH